MPTPQLHPRPPIVSLIAGWLLAGCTTTATIAPTVDLPEPPQWTEPPAEFIPVVRQGRYTLVELVPTAAQQDLLLQVIDVRVPDTLHASVGDALRHVLLRSGYRLCDDRDAGVLLDLPLPVAHYRLGPVLLRDALLTLAGPAWDLHIDDGSRRVCFTQAPWIQDEPDSPAEPLPTLAPGTSAETFPISEESRP
ncbi:PilL N-terminal domain-containing protein [Phytopseudomonas dryadis]|uniref:Pilus assembly protein PilL n=1 Tax=Phytopseudomonas dryadis TaxID=2487520 RepID=A0A4Q9QWH9_9GAMM|nr:PilL N-terminal domain-containing protein [Pseudomonas dryadis]TBU88442.1 hypothetical protein DNK44_18260 [Pseudomonas dryadis]